MIQTTALLGTAGMPSAGSGISTLVMMLLFVAGMWFLMIAPQRKKQKEQEKMINALQSGDEVITSCGIYGTITNVKGDRFVLKIADNTKIEMHRSFIQSKIEKKNES